MCTVSSVEVVGSEQVAELALPPRIQAALGKLVNAAKEGLLALSVGVGLGVLAELLEIVRASSAPPSRCHARSANPLR